MEDSLALLLSTNGLCKRDEIVCYLFIFKLERIIRGRDFRKKSSANDLRSYHISLLEDLIFL